MPSPYLEMLDNLQLTIYNESASSVFVCLVSIVAFNLRLNMEQKWSPVSKRIYQCLSSINFKATICRY